MTKTLQPEFIRSKIMDCAQVMIYRYFDHNKRSVIAFQKDFTVGYTGPFFFTVDGNFAEKYMEGSFPVELFFYKKGNPFYITAKGVAGLENNERCGMPLAFPESRKLLVVTICSCELVALRRRNWLQKYTTIFYSK
jgi:hypothetical protein